jgi:dTDP-glucose 4,6-dehydratase
MRKTIEWYLGNADWLASVTSGEYQKWIARNYTTAAA